jgi:hypothetical protein
VSRSTLLDEVLEAHGGLERWRETNEVRARVRSGGLLLRTRFPRGTFVDYDLRVEVAEPHALFTRFSRAPQRAVFEQGRVRIETENAEPIAARGDPRGAFSGLSGLRRNFRWDLLDAVYFAGYAMWNYVSAPLLLTREGIEVREGPPWSENGEPWRRLEVTFPERLDTHSREQTFYVDPNGLIRRHDYTAEVVGSWAKAAHYCDAHREISGLVFPTRRRVVPRRRNGRPRSGPTLVWIELDELEVA